MLSSDDQKENKKGKTNKKKHMMISDESFVAFLLCNPGGIWPRTVAELPEKDHIAKITQKLESPKKVCRGSV